MRSSFRKSMCSAVAATIAMLAVSAQPVGASPVASLEFVETGLGGGLFQYDYVLSNLGDPVTDTGFDVFDFGLFFSPLTSLVSSTIPIGWDLIDGSGFLDTFSLQPGVSPLGTDVGPGQSLGGFHFVFNGQVGSVPFQAVFANPIDPNNPVVFDGVTAPAQAATVPEPTSLLLLGTMLSFALARRRRARE